MKKQFIYTMFVMFLFAALAFAGCATVNHTGETTAGNTEPEVTIDTTGATEEETTAAPVDDREPLYVYSSQELTEIFDRFNLHIQKRKSEAVIVIDPTKDTFPVYFTSDVFEQFVEEETTLGEIVDVLGTHHASYGSGIIRFAYLTADRCIVRIMYHKADELKNWTLWIYEITQLDEPPS